MSRLRATLTTMALLTAPALVACGEDEEPSRAAAPTASPASAKTATEAASALADLAGTWRVTVKRSELPDSHDNPKAKSSDFELEFHATGGRDDGASMTLDNVELGAHVLPISLTAEQIEIEEFVECRMLSYAVDGERLTFKTDPACLRRHTLPAILATRPWRRAR